MDHRGKYLDNLDDLDRSGSLMDSGRGSDQTTLTGGSDDQHSLLEALGLSRGTARSSDIQPGASASAYHLVSIPRCFLFSPASSHYSFN